MTPILDKPDRDITKGHPLIQSRWPELRDILQTKYNITLFVNEVYRSDARQQWLYGAGRTAEQLALKGIPAEYARPTEPKVTNAWSSKTSAHGLIVSGVPASAAMDVVPVGVDGKPWTKDDNWDLFVSLTDDLNDVGGQIGLIHFHAPGKDVWDKPHIQLIEWSDATHSLKV